MRYFDAFSGYGGFSLGIQKAYDSNRNRGQQTKRRSDDRVPTMFESKHSGAPTCIGYSEINKYAIETYSKHFPEHKNYGDLTKINAEELPDFDLFTGGFPCQAFSIAGKRKGFDDTRGTLFFDIARILRAKRPRLLLLENVKGLLSHDNGKTFSTIISTLDEIGYDLQWQVLNAKHFGVPQNRERVFIIGHLRGTSRPQVFPITGSNPKNLEQIVGGGQGNRVYSSEGVACTQASQAGGQGAKTGLYAIPEATKKGYALAREGDSINLSVPNSKTRRGRVGGGVAQTLDTAAQQYTIQDCKIRRLTPTECERLMGLPDGWTEGHSDSQRYKLCGNGVVVNVVEEIVKRLITKDKR